MKKQVEDWIRLANNDWMIRAFNDLGIDEKKLLIINEVYIESRYPSELGLMPDGMPSDNQANEFVTYAKEIKAILLAALYS